jgi:hypothetical protein
VLLSVSDEAESSEDDMGDGSVPHQYDLRKCVCIVGKPFDAESCEGEK